MQRLSLGRAGVLAGKPVRFFVPTQKGMPMTDKSVEQDALEPLTWTNAQRRLGDLVPQDDNPKEIDKASAARLKQSRLKFGQVQTLAISPDGHLLDGHQRQAVWAAAKELGPDLLVDVRVASRELTPHERHELTVLLQQGTTGSWVGDKLLGWGEADEHLIAWGLDKSQLLDWRRPDMPPAGDADTDVPDSAWGVVIECVDEDEQVELIQKLTAEGLQCRALIS